MWLGTAEQNTSQQASEQFQRLQYWNGRNQVILIVYYDAEGFLILYILRMSKMHITIYEKPELI